MDIKYSDEQLREDLCKISNRTFSGTGWSEQNAILAYERCLERHGVDLDRGRLPELGIQAHYDGLKACGIETEELASMYGSPKIHTHPMMGSNWDRPRVKYDHLPMTLAEQESSIFKDGDRSALSEIKDSLTRFAKLSRGDI